MTYDPSRPTVSRTRIKPLSAKKYLRRSHWPGWISVDLTPGLQAYALNARCTCSTVVVSDVTYDAACIGCLNTWGRTWALESNRVRPGVLQLGAMSFGLFQQSTHFLLLGRACSTRAYRRRFVSDNLGTLLCNTTQLVNIALIRLFTDRNGTVLTGFLGSRNAL